MQFLEIVINNKNKSIKQITKNVETYLTSIGQEELIDIFIFFYHMSDNDNNKDYANKIRHETGRNFLKNHTIASFNHLYVTRVNIVEKIDDILNLSVTEAKTKWETNKKDNIRIVREHSLTQMSNEKLRKQNIYNQSLNEKTYTRIMKNKHKFDNHMNESWYIILYCTTEELSKKTITFWLLLQLERLDINIQRSVIHKLELYTREYGKTCLPAQTLLLLDDTKIRMSVPKNNKLFRWVSNLFRWVSKKN